MDIEYRKIEREELLENLFDQFLKVYSVFFKTSVSSCMDAREDLKKRLGFKESLEHWFLALDGAEIVGFSVLGHGLPKGKTGWFDVFTLPGHDQNGPSLLNQAITCAIENGIGKIWTSSYSKQTWDLIESFGGKEKNTSVERMLRLKDCNWGVVDSWLSLKGDGWTLKSHYRMGDGLADEIAELSFEAYNEVRAMDGFPATEDKEAHLMWQRDLDRIFENQGNSLICFTINLDGKGAAGFIEGTISKSEPDFFLQRLIAVRKDLRGRGIGKHLKALMLDHIRASHPEIVKIKTANNAANLPAIALNEKLGFEIIGVYKEFEIDAQKAVKLSD